MDTHRPAALARFWASALDDYEIAPYDDEELARSRAMGIDSPEDDPGVMLLRVDGAGPRIFLTFFPEPKTMKNRVHVDVTGDHTTLPTLGAVVVADHDDHVILADPEGNEFRVFP
ncbi:VOC family protein [Kibdelosporangium phytohabitans]|uniref:VOC family protein n=1 Tax=Kibdelosporangium phytohabitans TaxID=860235 RepID=UPI001F447CED|nr:VOC family protein [Kibdelosporangium phytohabitans]